MKVVVFASQSVGEQTLAFMLEQYRTDLAAVVLTDSESPLRRLLVEAAFPASAVLTQQQATSAEGQAMLRAIDADYFILAWWPHIVKEPLLSMPRQAVLNFHPSLLPYNRGKDPNFWALVEGAPFGVTIHVAEAGIDAGDILFQREIPTDWQDTGETLYRKSLQAMSALFAESYPKLRAGAVDRRPQPPGQGSFHRRKELSAASWIDLDQPVTARELLNRLRARTFPPHPGCRFEAEGKTYDVRVSIQEVKD